MMQNGTSKNNGKPITLNDLAIMVKNGFDEVGNKFDEVGHKFDEVGNKIESINKRLSTLESQVSKIDSLPTREQIDNKLANMEARLKEDLGEKPMQRDRVLNTKTDTVAQKLGNKSVFTTDDIHDIARISPFAVRP